MSSNRRTTTVLVVDDENEILRIIDNILQNQGYNVVLARGAEQALRAFERMTPKPDLILSDVVMPGISGPMLIEQLQRIQPDLDVLFMSGYDDRQVVRKYVLDKGFSLITKPFNIKTLRESVKRLLEGAEAPDAVESAR